MARSVKSVIPATDITYNRFVSGILQNVLFAAYLHKFTNFKPKYFLKGVWNPMFVQNYVRPIVTY